MAVADQACSRGALLRRAQQLRRSHRRWRPVPGPSYSHSWPRSPPHRCCCAGVPSNRDAGSAGGGAVDHHFSRGQVWAARLGAGDTRLLSLWLVDRWMPGHNSTPYGLLDTAALLAACGRLGEKYVMLSQLCNRPAHRSPQWCFKPWILAGQHCQRRLSHAEPEEILACSTWSFAALQVPGLAGSRREAGNGVCGARPAARQLVLPAAAGGLVVWRGNAALCMEVLQVVDPPRDSSFYARLQVGGSQAGRWLANRCATAGRRQ